MKSALIAAALMAYLSTSASQVHARCSMDDFICEKFARLQAQKRDQQQAHKRRSTTRSVRRTAAPPRVAEGPGIATAQSPSQATNASSRSHKVAPTGAALRTSMVREIVPRPPVAEIERLPGTAIAKPPENVAHLIFGAGDQLEERAARCEPPVSAAARRVSCTVATHQVRLTNDSGQGCTGSLTLQHLTFIRDDQGVWSNEDSIALCGGRLLRRTAFLPIAIDGAPTYAMNETFELIGGDRTCARPYLESRRPLAKSFMPLRRDRATSLRCGTLAATN